MIKIILVLVIILSSECYGYFDYEENGLMGRFWTRENENKNSKRTKQITPIQAKEIVEKLRKEVEDATNMLIADPNIENARAYREKNAKLMVMVEKVTKMWTLAGTKYPHLVDNFENPSNVPAVRVRREIEQKNRDEEIKWLYKNFDLVLFREEGCLYCEQFEPILRRFADTYDVQVTAVSSTSSKYFPTRNAPELAKRLNVSTIPSVVLVHKSRPFALELIRGMTTFDALEELSSTAKQYIDHEGVK